MSLVNLKSLVVAAVISCGLFGAGVAEAGYPPHSPCYFKTVTIWKAVREPVVHYVTKSLPCGTPYRDRVVTWKTVQVPVKKQVRVCY